jgi:hypothetical protein
MMAVIDRYAAIDALTDTELLFAGFIAAKE